MNDLPTILAQTKAAEAALSPAQRAKLRAQQRRSWVIGEMMLADAGLTYSKACRLYDELTGGIAIIKEHGKFNR